VAFVDAFVFCLAYVAASAAAAFGLFVARGPPVRVVVLGVRRARTHSSRHFSSDDVIRGGVEADDAGGRRRRTTPVDKRSR